MGSPPFYEVDGQIEVELPGARGVFTTMAWGDARERVDALGERLERRVVHTTQVHGAVPLQLRSVPSESSLSVEADAILTTVEGVAPMVLTADCVPILVAGGGTVAAVHAGWKGLRDGIIRTTLKRLRALAPQAEFAAAIGPAAGPCCYEVADDLHSVFAERGQDFRSGKNLDLQAIARKQLELAGVEAVRLVNVCTVCSEVPRMHSYRRDGSQAGRQGAVVWLT